MYTNNTQRSCNIPVLNVLGGAEAPEAALDHYGKSRAKSLTFLHAVGKDKKPMSKPYPRDARLGPHSQTNT